MLRSYVYSRQAETGQKITYDEVLMEFLEMVGWVKKKR